MQQKKTLKKNKTVTKPRKRKNLWLDFVIYTFFSVLIIWGIFAFRDNYYTKHLDWVSSYQGVLEDSIDAVALIVRDETPLIAAVDGVLRKAVDSDTRVTAGSVIAYIDSTDGKSYAITAPKAGVVQFAVDGLESTLTAENYMEIDLPYLFSLLNKDGLCDTSIELSIGKSFNKGDIWGKIVDNLVDYRLLVYIEGEQVIDTQKTRMTVQLADGSVLSGKVETSGISDKGQYVVLLISPTCDMELLTRYMHVSFTGAAVSGVIVPYSALVKTEDGNYTLFYRRKNVIDQAAVKLLGYKGDLAVVSGITAGTDVVSQPKYAKINAIAYK